MDSGLFTVWGAERLEKLGRDLLKAQRILVLGRVQGVGFRHFVWRTAVELGAKGWVRNRHDGSVEILVFGDQTLLEDFGRRVAGGPSWGEVDEVIVDDLPPAGLVPATFEIRPSA